MHPSAQVPKCCVQLRPVFCNALISPSEPKSLPHLQRKDSRPGLLHGRPLPRGHEDMDGRHCHRSGGIHPVHGVGIRHQARTLSDVLFDLISILLLIPSSFPDCLDRCYCNECCRTVTAPAAAPQHRFVAISCSAPTRWAVCTMARSICATLLAGTLNVI